MKEQLPKINELTTIEAIHWYTKEVADAFCTKSRVAGTYSKNIKMFY
ncbi:hypothetical protein [Halobacillus seohaensis]|uniref:Uncharacterized protein n=1 Tax=Halobacillus seohaensis TaxID=447421 RepID=A0ABW2ELQ6_9BACI